MGWFQDDTIFRSFRDGALWAAGCPAELAPSLEIDGLTVSVTGWLS